METASEHAPGRTLALADKLDTLRECFRIGLVHRVEGSFALRRAAQGVVKILVERRLTFPITTLATVLLHSAIFFVDRVDTTSVMCEDSLRRGAGCYHCGM